MENVLGDEGVLCLDGIVYNYISKFLNHQCHDANLFDILVQIESNVRHIYAYVYSFPSFVTFICVITF
jgi:hypothetical protein